MAIVLTTLAAAAFREIIINWQDFRGQKRSSKILVDVGASDANTDLFLTALDNSSNAKERTAEVLTAQIASGQKAAALSVGAEVNIDEIMELTFMATDTSNSNKKITRSILIPAMVSTIENVDGSPIAVAATRPGTAGAAQDIYDIVAYLETHLTAKNAVGAYQQGFVYVAGKSHHIGLEDIVDTH